MNDDSFLNFNKREDYIKDEDISKASYLVLEVNKIFRITL